MADVPRYTVWIAVLNMADTVERSVRSIHDLTDDRFEIVVLDDGSDDGTAEIVERLADEFDRVRVVHGDNDCIGAARASAVEHARGKYVLHQLDADDEYECGIVDFVEIFHQIESQVDFRPYLSGKHIHMGSVGLLEETNYRPLGYNEDRDFWRRLIARGNWIGFLHRPIKQSLGYDEAGLEKASTRFEALVTQLRSGITARSYAGWLGRKLLGWRPGSDRSLVAILFRAVALPPALALATWQGRFEAPGDLSDMAEAEKALVENYRTLSGIERHYGITIDRSRLSDTGRRIYDVTPSECQPTRLYLGEQAPVVE